MTIIEMLKSMHMVQLTFGHQSLRVRRHRFFSGQYYITIRDASHSGDDEVIVAKNLEEVETLINQFCGR